MTAVATAKSFNDRAYVRDWCDTLFRAGKRAGREYQGEPWALLRFDQQQSEIKQAYTDYLSGQPELQRRLDCFTEARKTFWESFSEGFGEGV